MQKLALEYGTNDIKCITRPFTGVEEETYSQWVEVYDRPRLRDPLAYPLAGPHDNPRLPAGSAELGLRWRSHAREHSGRGRGGRCGCAGERCRCRRPGRRVCRGRGPQAGGRDCSVVQPRPWEGMTLTVTTLLSDETTAPGAGA